MSDKDKKKYRQGKKRIMKEFRIDEFAAVDFPAQAGAQAVLLKRGEAVLKSSLVLMTDVVEGHTHAVWIYLSHEGTTNGGETSHGQAEDGESHAHAWVFNPADGSLIIGENAGHTHSLDASAVAQAVVANALGKQDDNQSGKESDATTKEASMKPEEIEALNQKLADLTKQNERNAAVIALTAPERAHFDALDKAAQDEFLALDAAKRAEAITKAADKDAVVYTALDGTTFRKSDDARLVQMAKDRDEDRRELIKQRAVNEQSALEKRAEAELPSLPGTVQVRAAVLKALDGIADEATRKAAHEAVAAGDKAIKAAFDTVGSKSGAPISDAEKELDSLAKRYETEHKVSYVDAYDKVCELNPELARRAISGQ